MRKALTMLGALAALAVGSLFAAAPALAALPGPGSYTIPAETLPPAPATTVTCAEWGSGYPGPTNFLVCAPMTTAEKNGRHGVISTFVTDTKTPLQNMGVRYYLFRNYREYRGYFKAAGIANPPVPPSPISEYGFSFSPPSGQDPFVVVFTEVPIYSPVPGVKYNLNIVDETLAHESGHEMDYYWAQVSPHTGGTLLSATVKFQDLLKHDKFKLNNTWTGGGVNDHQPRNPCGSGGALVNLYDGTRGYTTLPSGSVIYGQYVCDGSSLRTTNLGTGGSTGYQDAYNNNTDLVEGRNVAVLKYVMPEWLDDRETFANAFAVVTGDRAPHIPPYSSQTRMIDAQFGCIVAIIASLYSTGVEPVGYNSVCTRTLP